MCFPIRPNDPFALVPLCRFWLPLISRLFKQIWKPIAFVSACFCKLSLPCQPCAFHRHHHLPFHRHLHRYRHFNRHRHRHLHRHLYRCWAPEIGQRIHIQKESAWRKWGGCTSKNKTFAWGARTLQFGLFFFFPEQNKMLIVGLWSLVLDL